MNISSRVLSERIIRVALVLGALLLALGYLLLGGTTVSRILGAAAALLIAFLLKSLYELFSQMRGLERDSHRSMDQLVVLSAKIEAALADVIGSQERINGLVKEIQPILDEIQQRTASLECSISDILKESVSMHDQLNNRIEGLREDTGRVVAELTARTDEVVAALQPVRRHFVKAEVPLRELSLRDSLAGLLQEDPAEGSA